LSSSHKGPFLKVTLTVIFPQAGIQNRSDRSHGEDSNNGGLFAVAIHFVAQFVYQTSRSPSSKTRFQPRPAAVKL